MKIKLAALVLAATFSFVSTAQAVVTPQTVIHSGIVLANDSLSGGRPEPTVVSAYAAEIASWAKSAKTDGSLGLAEGYFLQHRDIFLAGNLSATALFKQLKANGYLRDVASVSEAINSVIPARRKAIIKAIQAPGGLYSYVNAIALGMQGVGVMQPLVYNGCAMMDEGEDLMALGALISLWAPEAGLAMAAVGAALYFEGKYGIGCTNPNSGN